MHPSFSFFSFLSFYVRAMLIIALGLLSACGGESHKELPGDSTLTFTHDGLTDHTVNHFYSFDNQLFAATDKGLFIKTLPTGVWKTAGLSDMEVHDMVIFSRDHYLATANQKTNKEAAYRLMETTDAGVTWHQVTHNFGGDHEETILALHYDPTHHRLFATGVAAVAVSYDEGRSWQRLAGNWHSIGQPLNQVTHNTQTNEIWYGGHNALGQMLLCAYSIDSKTERCFSHLTTEPDRILGIQFDPSDSDRVLVTGDGGIWQSINNGETWTRILVEARHRAYFDLALDPQNSSTLYTGGWDKRWDSPQPLILEISSDNGSSWTRFRYPSSALFGGIKSMHAVNNRAKKMLYLGLHRGGVVKVTLPE